MAVYAFIATCLLTFARGNLLYPTERKVGQDRLAFRSHCEPLVHARLDPVVYKDKPAVSAHVHTVTGARSFGASVDATSDFDPRLRTTCNVAEDMSMYWSPALYHKDPKTGVLSIVKTTHTHYYIGIGDAYMARGNKLHAFPRNLRYIAGDNSDRTPGLEDDRASWHCIVDHPGEKNLFLHDPKYASLPPRFTKDGRECLSWQAVFKFPVCWDGVSLDSSDHKSHMAQMANFSECPESHPVLVPQLLFQVEFHLGDVPKNARSQDFVLANGDTTMASFHADYIAGFDEGVLAGLMEHCERDKGKRCAMASVADTPGNSDLEPFKLMPAEQVDNIRNLVLGPGTFASSSPSSSTTSIDTCIRQCRRASD